jgi:Putative zincin peptidase
LPVSWPSILLTLTVLVTLVVVHEAIHLLALPGGGVGNAVAGFWPGKGAAYVEYRLPVSQRRFVLVTLAPVLLLSVGVIAVAALGVRVPVPLQWASVLNAFGSGADLLVVCLVLRQSSPASIILGSGQQLYTREA